MTRMHASSSSLLTLLARLWSRLGVWVLAFAGAFAPLALMLVIEQACYPFKLLSRLDLEIVGRATFVSGLIGSVLVLLSAGLTSTLLKRVFFAVSWPLGALTNLASFELLSLELHVGETFRRNFGDPIRSYEHRITLIAVCGCLGGLAIDILARRRS